MVGRGILSFEGGYDEDAPNRVDAELLALGRRAG